jgi:hypothetical protein
MFKRFPLIVFIMTVFFSITILMAQDDYQKWLQKDQQQLKQFLEKEDQAFSDFLKKDWKAFQSFKGVKADSKPKPTDMPVAQDKDKPEIKPDVPQNKIDDELPPPPPKPKEEKKLEPPPATKQENLIKFNYFGASPAVEYKKEFQLALASPLNNQAIATAWEVMASSPHKELVDQLQQHKTKMMLNDWGYLILVNNFAKALLTDDRNQQNIYTWFLMIKSGFDAKIAFKDNAVFLLLPTQNMIYDNPFVTLDNKKYFFISLDIKLDLQGNVFTYNGTYEGATTLMQLKLASIPVIMNKSIAKSVQFMFNDQNYKFDIQYDNDVIDFFKNYPQTDLPVYFNAPVSGFANYSLLTALRPQVQGKTEVEAVNFLLRFVQTAFDYKTDDEQFGREKYLMPEETIYYPSSDCEDRSIFFSYLVRNLLGMEVVGLDYPGHIATAIHFETNLDGDAITHQGKKFIICDPTYINADAGMCMPQFKNVDPGVIQL